MPYEPIRREPLKQMLDKLREAIYKPIAELDVTAWVTPEPVTYEERMSGTEVTLAHGERWGLLWDCAWFRFSGRIPEASPSENVVLLLDVSGELCLVDQEGSPVQGLTTVNSEFDFSLGLPGKRVVQLHEMFMNGQEIEVWADGGNNDLFGNYRGGTLKEAMIAISREDIRSLYYDTEVLLETAEQLPDGSARKERMYQTLYDVSMLLAEFSEECLEQAKKRLGEQLSLQGGDHVLTISAVGHAHIDLAWLWPIRETIRKGARTFSTALRMMERYPDYVFGASQPQLYEWIKQRYPKLYAQIKERVREGRWEPQGAMWVESDTNVPGGESLVRQILYGKRYFQQEFGLEMKSLWMPDVFGYSASLPQILKKSGVDYMMTQKLSWSEYNRYPHHSFLWEGIDGSAVLTHMPPEDTYNSPAAPRSIVKAEREYLDKNVSGHALMLFGIGDGGGGPGEEHLERLSREKNLLGLSPVTQEPSWKFFERLNKERARFQTWRGELYLEKHQGTLTSQARSKRYNRKMEKALRELEFASVLAAARLGRSYPSELLETIWKEVLLYQFHDILPGSSIQRVYDESLIRYEELLQQTEAMITDTYSFLADHITSQDDGSARIVVFNSLPWTREEWLHMEGRWRKVRVPSMGYTVMADGVDQSSEDEAASSIEMVPETWDSGIRVTAEGHSIESDTFIVQFDQNGAILSILDKGEAREVIPQGRLGNDLRVYHDNGDAWDFRHDYAVNPGMPLILRRIRELRDGPRIGLFFEYSYGESSLSQTVVLTEGSRRIDFETRVDWREDGKMLRTSFPVHIRADQVHCEIQFGSLSRPTHRNTMWDFAKDEICAHQWIDLSEPDYGVALLNDCKYGHRVIENVLDLNLLRSSSYPDPAADRAEHAFAYSLYPHPGNHVQAEVYRRGHELNIPLRTVSMSSPPDPENGQLPYTTAFLEPDHPYIMVESVKKAEDGDDIIIRLYETSGTHAKAALRLGFQALEAWMADLMENIIAPLPIADSSEIALAFTPFQIITLRLKLPQV
ncbi:alpha-mannosidase [Paenibacillus glucanolyticus]|uniref:Alpha-mannosidase n=1 Tax=Paenibacillus glucanolyticus TaxID=59843 RepID=A0A163M5C7_9BACL|nr:glycoside hydrolase family 38 C-terminal domain-containing protein [Paenibacillus glucanolyticus]KZS48752.1 alpha-mannosidase [Paenibacillus glucanolyticus]